MGYGVVPLPESSFMAAALLRPYRRRFPLKTSSSLGAPTAGDIELELQHFVRDKAPKAADASAAARTPPSQSVSPAKPVLDADDESDDSETFVEVPDTVQDGSELFADLPLLERRRRLQELMAHLQVGTVGAVLQPTVRRPRWTWRTRRMPTSSGSWMKPVRAATSRCRRTSPPA